MFSKPALLLCLVVVTLVKDSDAAVDIKKMYEEHSSCNGEPATLPPGWLGGGLIAASQCLDIKDEFCALQCVVFHYPGVVKKDGKLNMEQMKGDTKQVKLSPKNVKALDDMLNGLEKCANIHLPNWDRPTTPLCPNAQKFGACFEEEFQYACKGVARPPE